MSISPVCLSLSSSCRALPVLALLLSAAFTAAASPITFTGQDNNVQPGGSHPNASAAAAAFDTAAAAIGPESVITFESAPLGSFSSLNVAPGVTVTGTNYSGGNQQILNAPDFPGFPPVGGYNTTTGGSQYADMQGGTLIFTFTNPTQFFGVYLTGIQTNFFQDTITFSDGTSETIDAPGVGTTSSVGALDFVGFTDAGKSISSVTITASQAGVGGYDAIGVDDVRYESAAVTPEPNSFVLLLSGLAVLGIAWRRMRLTLPV